MKIGHNSINACITGSLHIIPVIDKGEITSTGYVY